MKFIADNDRLIIRPEGTEILLSLRRKIVVPKSKITELNWTAHYTYSGRRVIRLAGVALRGVIFSGSFWGPVGWYFLYIRKPSGSRWLKGASFSANDILDIQAGNYIYKRLILDCPPEIGAELMKWFHS